MRNSIILSILLLVSLACTANAQFVLTFSEGSDGYAVITGTLNSKLEVKPGKNKGEAIWGTNESTLLVSALAFTTNSGQSLSGTLSIWGHGQEITKIILDFGGSGNIKSVDPFSFTIDSTALLYSEVKNYTAINLTQTFPKNIQNPVSATASAIPEPSTYATLLGAFALAIFFARKRFGKRSELS